MAHCDLIKMIRRVDEHTRMEIIKRSDGLGLVHRVRMTRRALNKTYHVEETVQYDLIKNDDFMQHLQLRLESQLQIAERNDYFQHHLKWHAVKYLRGNSVSQMHDCIVDLCRGSYFHDVKNQQWWFENHTDAAFFKIHISQ
jgi:hypothetical protein